MNVLEKILEEIESREFTNTTIRHSTAVKMKDIRSIFRKYMDKATYKRSDDLIDRKTLKEEVESFRITITGMRNGKTITAWALREYKKSILRIIDEQPGHGEGINIPTDDGWIPVEERLPGEGQKVLVWYEYCRYGEYNRMLKTYGIGWQFDGHWGGDVSGTKARCIAWQPLPEPYRRFKKELS